MVRPLFSDRREAGRALGETLAARAPADPVVVALPRGGVPVAYEIALALGAPLDIGLVRKLGAPGHPEYGIGALGEDGTVIVDGNAIDELHVTRPELEQVLDHEAEELERRRALYRGGRAPLSVDGKTVVLVDDGLATGVTAIAAARMLHARGAKSIVLAVPVCPRESRLALREAVDSMVCLASPEPFFSVGTWYADFTQTTDAEVAHLLRAASVTASRGAQPAPAEAGSPVAEWEVRIPTGREPLTGTLRLPPGARGLVVFAHGSGSGRRSPRNLAVAEELNEGGLGTLLFDLLTPEEAGSRHNTFDISLLTQRLILATAWTREIPQLRQLPLGYFGASTGAAAALCAAASLGPSVGAVVSRGGRPDLAESCLPGVEAPTLLIVG